MRVLGLLFVIAVIVIAIGLYQGWFSVRTTEAAGKSSVELSVDKEKMSKDTRAAAEEVGRLGAKAAEKLRSLARKVSPQESELEGNIISIDAASRDITVATATSTVDLRVPAGVPIKRDGMVVGFDELHNGSRVNLKLKNSGDDLRLVSITLLP
jgi:hypothetical protein